MVNRGEEIWTSRNKTNEILTVYLRKRQTSMHQRRINKYMKRIHDFCGPEALTVKLESIFTVWKGKECGVQVKRKYHYSWRSTKRLLVIKGSLN